MDMSKLSVRTFELARKMMDNAEHTWREGVANDRLVRSPVDALSAEAQVEKAQLCAHQSACASVSNAPSPTLFLLLRPRPRPFAPHLGRRERASCCSAGGVVT